MKLEDVQIEMENKSIWKVANKIDGSRTASNSIIQGISVIFDAEG